jgi:hypothetical protein
MTSKNQVSPVIRISRGERDASARATHLKAASKKYLETTIERKQMSTTTNFKRIALVAVAALGLGVLSSVPSNAAIVGTIAVTDSATSTATTSLADSTTAGTLAVRWLATTAGDTVGVTTSLNTQPSGGGSPTLNFYQLDTSTSISNSTMAVNVAGNRIVAANDADTATITTGSTVGYTAGRFRYQLDQLPLAAGTYTYTLTFTPYTAAGVAETTARLTRDVSVVVTAPASASKVAAAANSRVRLASGLTMDSETADNTSLALLATASSTPRASAWVKLVNAAGVATATEDSLTVTIDKGNIGTANNAPVGKNVIIDYKPAVGDGGLQFWVYSDGSSGPATITVATKNAGSFTKTLTWYGADYATITAAAYRNVIGIGTEATLGAVSATAADALGSSYGSATTVFAYSSDTSVISNFGTACTYDSTTKAAMCPLTGVKAGTANITIRDASTVALSKATSNAVAVRVSQGVATSFTLKTDKATYAPGEKGFLWVTVLDAAGLSMPVRTDAATLATGGITSSVQVGSASDTTTATTFSTERSATPASNDPVKVYTFFAPVTGGPIVFSAKGAAGFSAASIATATTVTATVTDSGAAALAAVTALATTVASLRTLIVTLTNLVLKIQKKVRA